MAPRTLALCALALAARVAAGGFVGCPAQPPGKGPSAEVVNGGWNRISIFLCNASAPSPALCAISGPAVWPCQLDIQPNSTIDLELTWPAGVVTAVVLQYGTADPFNFHAIASAAPVFAPWPIANGTLPVPYPAPGALLCDTSADCPAGATCLTSPAPARCSSALPSPSATPAPPAPVPSPTPGPAAATCNITGSWEQPHANLEMHSADAFINISVTNAATGALMFDCVSKRNLCPGSLDQFNGTGLLSRKDASFTLTPGASGGPTVTGSIVSTYACNALTINTGPGVPVQLTWNLQSGNGPAKDSLNTAVSVATYLGSGTGAGQLLPTGVGIVSVTGKTAVVAVAGNGLPAFRGVTPIALLNGTAASNGTILIVSVDAAATPAASAAKVLAVLKVGDRIDSLRVNGEGVVAVAGSFGIAALKGLDGTGAPSIAWHDDLAGVEPGSCGVCCSDGANCAVDIGEDGVVMANLAVAAAEGFLWALYSPTGARFAQWRVSPDSKGFTGVFVDAANSQAGVSYFYNSNTGKEPMVMPRVDVFKYDHAPGAKEPLALAYELFPWSATVYRSPGPCDGNVADGRVMSIRAGRDGTLLIGGRSDGGDSPWFCGMRNSSRVVPVAVIDGFNEAYNMAAQAITNFVRADAVTGEAIVMQQVLARLPSNQKGNTIFTKATQSDAATGAVYSLQQAGCCIADMPNRTINGQPLAGNIDATVLHVVTPNMERRLSWTHFVAPNSSGGGVPVDIDVRGGVVALAMTTGAQMMTMAAIDGTDGPTSANSPDLVGYLAVLPAIAVA